MTPRIGACEYAARIARGLNKRTYILEPLWCVSPEHGDVTGVVPSPALAVDLQEVLAVEVLVSVVDLLGVGSWQTPLGFHVNLLKFNGWKVIFTIFKKF